MKQLIGQERYITVIYPCERNFAFKINSNDTTDRLLENVFAWFNHGSGNECFYITSNGGARSLSVNDFVRIDGDVYQCKSVGWELVDELYLEKIEQLVEESMKTNDNVAWANLGDVMRNIQKINLTS